MLLLRNERNDKVLLRGPGPHNKLRIHVYYKSYSLIQVVRYTTYCYFAT
jgi:hypothetical protein